MRHDHTRQPPRTQCDPLRTLIQIQRWCTPRFPPESTLFEGHGVLVHEGIGVGRVFNRDVPVGDVGSGGGVGRVGGSVVFVGCAEEADRVVDLGLGVRSGGPQSEYIGQKGMGVLGVGHLLDDIGGEEERDFSLSSRMGALVRADIYPSSADKSSVKRKANPVASPSM